MEELSLQILKIEEDIRKLYDAKEILIKEKVAITRRQYPVVYVIRNYQEVAKKGMPCLTPLIDTDHGCFSTQSHAEDFLQSRTSYKGTVHAEASQNLSDCRVYNINKTFL